MHISKEHLLAFLDKYERLNHSGENRVALPNEEEPLEVIIPLMRGPGNLFSIALALILLSESHRNTGIVETYAVLEGELDIFKNGQRAVRLKAGETYNIWDVMFPEMIHNAAGVNDQPAVVLVNCTPGWTRENHLFVPQPAHASPIEVPA